jgi:hypothetical protein
MNKVWRLTPLRPGPRRRRLEFLVLFSTLRCIHHTIPISKSSSMKRSDLQALIHLLAPGCEHMGLCDPLLWATPD